MDLGNFFLVPVNYLAVLLGAVASMVIGYIWYGPLFGSSWMKLVGMTKDKQLKANENMTQTYAIMFVGSMVMAYVLAHFIWYAAPGSLTLFIAIKTAIWAWLGFVATYALTKHLYAVERKPWSLYLMDTGYFLITLIVMGVIFYFLK